jgi:hypothetical protein
MRIEAFWGLVILCALLTPAVAWLILERWGRLAALPYRAWLALYIVGALACVAVLPRKHIESAIIMRWPRAAWAWHLAQVDNEIWEQVGKLFALLIVLWWVGDPLRGVFAGKRGALAVGYWVGLCYGMGEALILALLFMFPAWGPVFGVNTFTPYTVGWAFVRERFWAMNLHAVMGALIGLGFYGFFALGSRWRLAAFFVLAMLYHHLVDGAIIAAIFVPAMAQAINALGERFVPLMLAIGFVILALAYLSQSGLAARDEGPPRLPQSAETPGV